MYDRSYVFPKGEYYFGDLRYLFPHNPYSNEWKDIFINNEEGDWDYKDKEYLLFNTGKDGRFFNHRSKDFKENTIPIVSGSVGLIPTDTIESKNLKKELGIIFKSEKYQVKVVVQGDDFGIYGIHIFQHTDLYDYRDHAILIVFDNEKIDVDYFYSRCPVIFQSEIPLFRLFEKDDPDEEDEIADRYY